MWTELMLIDGSLVEAADGGWYPSLDPSTGEVAGQAPDAGQQDVNAAVGAARRAAEQTRWAEDPGWRARCLHAMLDTVSRHRDEVRADLVYEGGVPVRLTASVQLDACLPELQWIADATAAIPDEISLGERDFHGYGSVRTLRYRPAGVAALLTPANFPAAILLKRVFVALAAGNTVVLKPAPDTPLVALHIARLIRDEVDLPPGVLNVLSTSDVATSEALVTHDGVDLVSLTGSSRTGRRVAALAAANLKRSVLYLGGKSVHLVLDDADPQAIAAAGARVCFHAGQACTLQTRLLVPETAYRHGIELLLESMSQVRPGPPDDPEVVMGPMVSDALRQRFLAAVRAAAQAGATVGCGGEVPAGLERGFFVTPTLVYDLPPEAPLVQCEVPGPVLAVLPYRGEAEAVELANSTPYGLAAAVTAGSLDRAREVARHLRAAALIVNDGLPFGPDAPYAGFGASGSGHNGGAAALDDYRVRQVLGTPVE